VFAQDEAIIKLNPTMRKVYAPKGTKPIRLVNGSKQKLYLFSVVSDEGNHCCTYDWINSDNFLKFVRYLLRMHKKIVLIVDRATWHTSEKVKDFVKKNKERLILWKFPKKLPELNPAEAGWKSARMNITYKLFKNTKKMGWAIKSHIRREFKVNLLRFWS